jgi:hypothetical protein
MHLQWFLKMLLHFMAVVFLQHYPFKTGLCLPSGSNLSERRKKNESQNAFAAVSVGLCIFSYNFKSALKKIN